jgi:hypothetical protein
MYVSQINPTTKRFSIKHSPCKNITGFIRKIQHRRFHKKMTVAMQNMQSINELYLKGNPEISSKVTAVENYVAKKGFSSPEFSKEYEPRHYSAFSDSSYDYLIGKCTNVDEIYKEFGSYGLIAYAQNMLSADAKAKLLPKSDNYRIQESMVLSDRPIVDIFSEYLNKNRVGYMKDLYQRFGKHGKDLFNAHRSIGFIDNGVDANFKETYGVTSRFLQIEVPFMERRNHYYFSGFNNRC